MRRMACYPLANRRIVEAEMRSDLAVAARAAAIKRDHTLFERSNVLGHAEPPRLDVQLSGVSSAYEAFLLTPTVASLVGLGGRAAFPEWPLSDQTGAMHGLA